MTIIITKVPYGFDVQYDGRIAHGLGFDEMIGLVAAISMPEPRPHLQWLKTPEQIAADEEFRRQLNERRETDGNSADIDFVAT